MKKIVLLLVICLLPTCAFAEQDTLQYMSGTSDEFIVSRGNDGLFIFNPKERKVWYASTIKLRKPEWTYTDLREVEKKHKDEKK